LVVTKIDLEPYVDSRAAVMVSNALRSNPRLRVFTTSAKTGDGIGPLIEFISEKLLHGKEA
jgi:Ni2+-binding GTPase involved in maturation of urease and hydrogenase